MTAIRITIAAVLGTAAVLAGGATAAQHSLPAKAQQSTITEAGPIACCDK
jgi:hypothetical protein